MRLMAPAGLASLFLAALPAPSTAGKIDCLSREGQCIAVKVGGQASVKLGKPTKKLMRGELKDASDWIADVRYELPLPIRGKLEIDARPAAGAESWFGPDPGAEVTVIPLGDVELKTHAEVHAEQSVRVGGQAALTRREVLEENRLPAGRYLLAVTLSGRSNWDRHVLYLEVKD